MPKTWTSCTRRATTSPYTSIPSSCGNDVLSHFAKRTCHNSTKQHFVRYLLDHHPHGLFLHSNDRLNPWLKSKAGFRLHPTSKCWSMQPNSENWIKKKEKIKAAKRLQAVLAECFFWSIPHPSQKRKKKEEKKKGIYTAANCLCWVLPSTECPQRSYVTSPYAKSQDTTFFFFFNKRSSLPYTQTGWHNLSSLPNPPMRGLLFETGAWLK